MSRKSSHLAGAPAGLPDSQPPRRASEYLGYEPTPGQRLVKSKFWQVWREDPSIDSSSVDASYVASRIDAPSIRKWWSDDGFREWFLGREEFRARADAAVNMWLDHAIRMLASGALQDKDFINLGKLLADMGGKLSKGASPGDSEPDAKPKLTEAQAIKQIERVAAARGWTPPKQIADGADQSEDEAE